MLITKRGEKPHDYRKFKCPTCGTELIAEGMAKGTYLQKNITKLKVNMSKWSDTISRRKSHFESKDKTNNERTVFPKGS